MTELGLGLLPAVESALAARRSALGERALSDFAFANLYLFRAAHAYRYREDPLPSIEGVTYDGARHVFPLAPVGTIPPAVIDELFADGACLFPLAAGELGAFDRERFLIEACRDDADYLYPVDNFLHYRGERLRTKRQAMARLLAAHELAVESLSADNREEALAVLAGWMDDKGHGTGGADEGPCREALDLLDALSLHGWLHRIDGRAAGFVIVQPLMADTLAVRFAKGRAGFPGLYPWMFHHLATTCRGAVKWLNFEQDLGKANFRRNKLSYAPAALLEKYRVRRKA